MVHASPGSMKRTPSEGARVPELAEEVRVQPGSMKKDTFRGSEGHPALAVRAGGRPPRGERRANFATDRASYRNKFRFYRQSVACIARGPGDRTGVSCLMYSLTADPRLDKGGRGSVLEMANGSPST